MSPCLSVYLFNLCQSSHHLKITLTFVNRKKKNAHDICEFSSIWGLLCTIVQEIAFPVALRTAAQRGVERGRSVYRHDLAKGQGEVCANKHQSYWKVAASHEKVAASHKEQMILVPLSRNEKMQEIGFIEFSPENI